MKVPIYQERVATVTPETRPTAMPRVTMPNTVPGAFGEDVGQAYETLGKVGEKIAGHLQQLAIDEQDKEVISRETAYMQDWQNRLTNQDDETIQVNGKEITRKKGLLLRQLGQAEGVTLQAKLAQKKLREEYLKGLSKYQADRLAPFLDRHYLSIEDKLVTHEANQRDSDLEQTIKSNVEQKISNAYTIRDGKALGLAVDDAIKSASIYYKKYDENTQKVKNEEIAQKIVSSAVDNVGDFQQADALLFQVKDKISPAFYNEKRNELLIEAKKVEKQTQLVIAEAKNKREEDLLSAHILQNNVTPEMIRNELSAGSISPKFAQAMVSNIESIKKIGTTSNSSTFNKLTDFILADNKPEETRLELLKENAKGEITDDELKILNTFNQAITKDTLEKAMPKKSFLQTISFWSDEYAGKKPEAKAQMFKEYMQKVMAGVNPETAVNEIIKKKTQEVLVNKTPSMANLPEGKGQLMIDAQGNKAIVYPDGTIEPKSEGAKYMESREKK